MLAYRLYAGKWLHHAVYAIGISAILATFIFNASLLQAVSSSWTRWIGIGIVVTAIAVFTRPLPFQAGLDKINAISQNTPLTVFLLIGLIVRIIWITFFPAEPSSDAKIYVALASRVAAGHTYQIANTMAYWPVGYPGWLALWFKLFGASREIWLISNLATFVIACLGIYRVTATIATNQTGKLAVLLFALWPNLIAMMGTPEKENLITAILPWSLYHLIRALQFPRSILHGLAAGFVLGICILVQPSLQLLPLAMGLLCLLNTKSHFRDGVFCAAVLIFGTALAIGPWTARNYVVFDRFVMISTNGGDNFYRANNAWATGGYTQKGEIDLSGLHELEQDKQGKQLAIAWIKSHPMQFARLGYEKVIRFLGDDATGIYNTFRSQRSLSNPLLYTTLKAVANIWWIAIWILTAWLIRQSRITLEPIGNMGLFVWLWIYLLIIHSVFESAGKYHVPALWALCSLFAFYITSYKPRVPT